MANNRYSASQLKGMRVNPYAPGDIQDAYPFLKAMVPEDTFGTNLNKFFRYVAFVYDPGSPMVKEYTAIGPRKKEAATETDFKLDHEADVRNIAFEYLKYLNSPLWTEIVCNETLFWEYAQKVTMEMTGDDENMLKAVERQGKMLEQMAKMRTAAGALRKEFFGGDDLLEGAVSQVYTPEGVNKATRGKK